VNQKIFIQKSDAILNDMSMEELRSCVHSIARKTPEKKRESFLQLLNDCRNENDQSENGNEVNDYQENSPKENNCEENNKKLRYKRLMPDKKVQDQLADIKNAFAKIEEGELCFSAEGNEDYSNGYWSSEWIWKYEDDKGIGRIIVDAVLFAHDCMNDCRYEEASTVFELVMDTQVCVEDQWGGDSFELNLEEMVEEELVRVNLKVLALDALYTDYQLQPAYNRANSLYLYFGYPYFRDIHIEDIFSIGREELRDTDVFLQSWIDYLKQQTGEIAARLLKEAILYYKGTEGLLEMAREGYKKHPSIYLAALLEYEKTHNYDKMKKTGKEALEKLSPDLKLRGEIALKTAHASSCMNDSVFMKKCWYEAFRSNSTVTNYLRLFADREVTKAYKDLAEKRIEELKISGNSYDQNISEAEKNNVSKMELKYLFFFSGHIDKVRQWCMEQKNPLGWSGNFVGDGVNLMLLYLYADNKLRKACKMISERISCSLGFHKSKDLIFMKENFVLETEVAMQKGEEIFWNIFCLWKENYVMTADDIRLYVAWLEAVIDKRIEGIVGGKYRNKYNDVALLAAALGEVKESLGMKMAKSTVINNYFNKYSRHSSFRGALREYMD